MHLVPVDLGWHHGRRGLTLHLDEDSGLTVRMLAQRGEHEQAIELRFAPLAGVRDVTVLA